MAKSSGASGPLPNRAVPNAAGQQSPEPSNLGPTQPQEADPQGPYRVWITALRTARFENLHEARIFAGQLFHDRDHAVILEKLAPNGCWLQLDRLA